MAKEYVPIFFDWIDNTQDLSAEEKGHLIDAVILYAAGSDEWIDQLQSSGEKIAFRFMRGQIDRNIAISKARSESGSSKREQKESNYIKTDQNGSNDIKTDQNESNFPKEKEKEKENNNKNKKENDNKFERFWSVYPRHVSKQETKRKFEKLNPDDELLETMIRAVEVQKKSDQWTRDNGQYIPHPSTWIHQRRWEDDVKPISIVSKRVSAQDYEQRDYSEVQKEIERDMDKEMEIFLKGAAG